MNYIAAAFALEVDPADVRPADGRRFMMAPTGFRFVSIVVNGGKLMATGLAPIDTPVIRHDYHIVRAGGTLEMLLGKQLGNLYPIKMGSPDGVMDFVIAEIITRHKGLN